MSISLGIKYPDGRLEIGPGAGQSTARAWAREARELGLPMLSQIEFNGWPQFGPDELENLIEEFGRLRESLERKCPGGYSEQIDAITAALRALQGESGWTGDFG